MTKIYPAIDIINGSCVRLTEGKLLDKTDYKINPLDMAQSLQDAGAEYLHIVDLDAAMNQGNNKQVIQEIVRKTNLKVQTGGGIRTIHDIKSLLDLGVCQCVIGSAAIKQKTEVKQWVKEIGSEQIIIAADMLDGKIVTGGWKGKTSIDLEDFISDYALAGAKRFLCTDVSKDGKLEGSAISLYDKLARQFPSCEFIASGGVSSIGEIEILKGMKMYGIIIGKAIYEEAISLDKLFAI